MHINLFNHESAHLSLWYYMQLIFIIILHVITRIVLLMDTKSL